MTHSIELRKDDERDGMVFQKKLDLFSIEKSSNKVRASFIERKHTNSEKTEKG